MLIILNTGEHVVGKFRGSSSNYIKLENKKIKWSDIRSSTIYKDKMAQQSTPPAVIEDKCAQEKI